MTSIYLTRKSRDRTRQHQTEGCRPVTEDEANMRVITVFKDETGTLVIEVVDSGPLVEDFWGTDDYEFWYRVPADRIKALARRLDAAPDRLIEEIEKNWLDERFYVLEDILRESDIAAKFVSYA